MYVTVRCTLIFETFLYKLEKKKKTKFEIYFYIFLFVTLTRNLPPPKYNKYD